MSDKIQKYVPRRTAVDAPRQYARRDWIEEPAHKPGLIETFRMRKDAKDLARRTALGIMETKQRAILDTTEVEMNALTKLRNAEILNETGERLNECTEMNQRSANEHTKATLAAARDGATAIAEMAEETQRKVDGAEIGSDFAEFIKEHSKAAAFRAIGIIYDTAVESNDAAQDSHRRVAVGKRYSDE